MMASLKFNLISISIRWCFTFALVFYCTCEGNFTTVNTPQGINFATPSTTAPNITELRTTTPSKQSEPNCHAVPPTPFISNFQFGAFLLVCIFALMCIVYLLYLKRMEVESKKCSCRMQRMCQLGNPSEEPRYSLDPLTVSKLLAHHNATVVPRNEPNTSKASDQAISSTIAVPNTPNAELEKEIHTWNAHKYLEYLKNEDEHVYEDPALAVPQRKHLNNNLNLPSASNAQVSHNQRLTSFNINETVRISPKTFQKEESNGRF
ncbi:uncharacterized protein LOC135841670 [Planococcus citri]|uniref:uncharacterized protein LOC135841670 n=1 Tax=Planococcus citri TaxID=170843 RepID=UPI0031F9647E